MKKTFTFFILLLVSQLYAFRQPGGGTASPLGIPDSTLAYLEGDWVQSYRAHIYFLPLCELSCYPLLGNCYADFNKFEVAPVTISYRKWSDTTAGIIRPKGALYNSEALNDQFLDAEGNESDTIFLKKYKLAWVLDSSKSKSSLVSYLNTQLTRSHFYNFFNDAEKVVFERVPHRELGKYITQFSWMYTSCSVSKEGQIFCQSTSQPEHFYLKNDTIYGLSLKRPLFVYSYEANGYIGLYSKDIRIKLNGDSTKLEAYYKGTLMISYPKISTLSISDYSKYLGVWVSTKVKDHQISISQQGKNLEMRRVVSQGGNEQHRVGGVYALPFTELASVVPQNTEFAFLASEAECTPSYSRFVLSSNNAELIEQYTGEVFSKVTQVDDATQEQSIYLMHNPIVEGLLQLKNVSAATYEIYSATGMLLTSGHTQGIVPVRHLQPGAYLIKLGSLTGAQTLKFVVTE